MNILSAENIIKAYGDKPVLDGVDFFLQENEKVGIIGINGTGKTTLLRILAGISEGDSGKVVKSQNIVISYLPQNPVFEEGDTIIDSILKGVKKENHDEWDILSQGKNLLTKLGIEDFEQLSNTLSGGQKKKVALVSTLISDGDILIMDEPTNHLDNEMADFLEDYLRNIKKALIMVTHDRYFLDSVTNKIVEIDNGKLYSYNTNYSGFLELKAQREEMESATNRKLNSILRNELMWIRRGARARSTKQKARIERYEELKNRVNNSVDAKLSMSSVSNRLGKTTIELEHIYKSFGEKELINDFSYIFLKEQKVAFIGENGCGKTTLMKIIAGLTDIDSGKRIVGPTVKIGYYTQEIEADKSQGIAYMNPELRVIDYIRETAEFVMTSEGSVSASVMLERFLFTPEKQYNLIGKLSGGEKRRLNLLRVLMEAPNVLILDEPTNDLDISTLTILEDYLDSFDGIIIIVSHDRYFLDRTVNRIFAFENGKINQYEGNYSDYILRKEMKEENNLKEENKLQEKKKTETWVKTTKLKFSYQESRDFLVIEDEVMNLEEKIENITKDMDNYASDFIKLNSLLKEKEELEILLNEKMERWMYLQDLNEKINEQ